MEGFLDVLFSRRSCRLLALGALMPLAIMALPACSAQQASEGPARLVLASTTSTQDSGLFDVLIPAFEEAYPQYEVEVLAVGTGEALELGRRKDADVLLVHSTPDEIEFVEDGYGLYRRDVMYNDFIIAGPAEDPADITTAPSATDAFEAIAGSGATFISRGDDSGTHKAERALWQAAGIEPAGRWYVEAGQGMGACLTMADEKGAYVLTDRATYLNMRDDLDLEVLFEGDEALRNQYGVIPVAGASEPEGAEAFADWVTGPDGQAVIGAYGVGEWGQPLFFPDAGE